MHDILTILKTSIILRKLSYSLMVPQICVIHTSTRLYILPISNALQVSRAQAAPQRERRVARRPNRSPPHRRRTMRSSPRSSRGRFPHLSQSRRLQLRAARVLPPLVPHRRPHRRPRSSTYSCIRAKPPAAAAVRPPVRIPHCTSRPRRTARRPGAPPARTRALQSQTSPLMLRSRRLYRRRARRPLRPPGNRNSQRAIRRLQLHQRRAGRRVQATIGAKVETQTTTKTTWSAFARA